MAVQHHSLSIPTVISELDILQNENNILKDNVKQLQGQLHAQYKRNSFLVDILENIKLKLVKKFT